jgi:hypothetical protein
LTTNTNYTNYPYQSMLIKTKYRLAIFRYRETSIAARCTTESGWGCRATGGTSRRSAALPQPTPPLTLLELVAYTSCNGVTRSVCCAELFRTSRFYDDVRKSSEAAHENAQRQLSSR